MSKNDRNQVIEVVAAVVMQGDFVLAVQRGKSKYLYTDHKWEFPGGKIETGETETEALEREMKEEMDYAVVPQEKLGVVEHDYPDFSIRMHCWQCVPAGDAEAFELKEHAQSAWLRAEELKDPDWCEADEKVVDLLIEKGLPYPIPAETETTPESETTPEADTGAPSKKELWMVLALIVVMALLYFLQRR